MKAFPLAIAATLFCLAILQQIKSIGARAFPMTHEMSPLTQEWVAAICVFIAGFVLYWALPKDGY